MIRLSTLVEQFEQPLLVQYFDRLLPEHRQALSAIKPCRSALRPQPQGTPGSSHGPPSFVPVAAAP